jgi:hypothetical protein
LALFSLWLKIAVVDSVKGPVLSIASFEFRQATSGQVAAAGNSSRFKIARDFIPLVIIVFGKKDGGISGCSKKKRPEIGTFF